MSRKLELEVTVSGATIKVFSDPSVPPDEARLEPPKADPYAVTLSAAENAGECIRKLGAFFDNMAEGARVTALAFLRERYHESGRRR